MSVHEDKPLPLGNRRRYRERSYTLRTADGRPIPANLDDLGIFVDQLATADGAKTIPEESVRLRWSNQGASSFKVTVCVEAREVQAGSYTGAIRIDDPRFKRSDIDISVTRQAHPITGLAALMLIVGLVGALWRYAAEQRALTPAQSPFSWSALRAWGVRHYAAVTTGFVAITGALLTAAARTPSLGEKWFDLIVLVAGAFGIMEATITTGEVISPKPSQDNAPPAA